MFSDEILTRILADQELRTIPVGCQSTAINVIERILDKIKEEQPYATLSDILSNNE